MKKDKQSKKIAKKRFNEAVKKELREHKSSFIVFNVLRLIVIGIMIRSFFLQNYATLFLCALTVALLYLPSWLQVRLHIELPPVLEITIFCFIFAAEILGEVHAFYIIIPSWDTILHTLNGFLAAAVGFSLVVLLNNDEKLTFELSPSFMAITAFCFSMTVAVIWEMFEFSMDWFFLLDMQKDTIINSIYSVNLDPMGSNAVVGITDINEVIINGEPLGLGGYLDIGLIDTMKDIIVNFAGAVLFSISGYFYVKTKGYKTSMAQNFVPTLKHPGKDYLLKDKD